MRSLRDLVPERTVQNWLLPIEARSLDAGDDRTELTLAVPSRFCAQYLQSRFQGEIRRAVCAAVGESTDIVYEVVPSVGDDASEDVSRDDAATPSSSNDAGAPSATGSSSGASPSEAPPRRPATSADRSSSPERANRSASASASASTQSARSASGRPAPNRQRGASSPSEGTHANGGRSNGHRRNESASPRPPANSDPSGGTSYGAGAPLKPTYTFAEFIEGDGNRLARSAAVAVAQKPGGTSYNPLLVYGGVGLGKTHLAQAIANHALEQKSAETVLYVSSDRFTSQFVQAVKNHSIPRFSQYYRQADLLIVDDVQFFGGKEKTQEEFFHIFNELHQCGKQIVLCADRPPREIEGIEKRLLSRFQWGLSADIQRPDLETRIAILQRKSANRDIDVDPRVLELLAHRIDSNIRQLEGALNRLAALAHLHEGTLDLQTARSYLSDQIEETHRVPDPSAIIEQVATYYRLSTDDLLSRSRKQAISSARQIAMYLCRELTEQSYASIGSRFGGRDHSTVIHAHRKVEDRMDVEPDFRDDVDTLRSRLSNGSISGRLG